MMYTIAPPSAKNRVLSDIAKKKISEAHKGKSKNYKVWNVGISWHEETKQKISKSKIGNCIDKIYTKKRSEKISNTLCKSIYELISPK